jgi:hypothetical protein
MTKRLGVTMFFLYIIFLTQALLREYHEKTGVDKNFWMSFLDAKDADQCAASEPTLDPAP